MPSLLLPRFTPQDMADKKSPPRKEKSYIVRTPQPDDKGMKRKLLSPASPTHDDDDKRTPSKRKRGSVSLEASPMTNAKTPGGGSRSVPLSERQQLAMIMRMSDVESTQDPITKPPSPTPIQSIKKTQFDKKVFKRNERGEMPIHIAAIKGDIKLLKRLIKAGADVNVADFAGWTPLHEASNRGWFSIAKQLLKAGANVNVQGLENDTPLHDASINGHRKLVELLLKHGANPLQPNAKGKTPLDVAASADMIKILKKETLCSGSDTSSIEDVRSPMSPDSIISMKDDDKSLDLEDIGSSNHNESYSSSSSNRRHSMPKSPDGKLSSPRLCLKFHRDHFGHSYQKSRDSTEPQYKSYSVTNMSVDSNIENPMFSPSDSPASSVDSDLYNPGLDGFTHFSGSRLKLSLVDDENSQPTLKPSVNISALKVDNNTIPSMKEVFPENSSLVSEQNSDVIGFSSGIGSTGDTELKKGVLDRTSTLPFQVSSNWNIDNNSETDSPAELPDLEIDTTGFIPSSDSKPTTNISEKSAPECQSVTSSSSSRSPCQFGVNHSSVTSTTEPLEQPKSSTVHTINDDKCQENSDISSNSVENLSNKECDQVDSRTSEPVNCVTNMLTDSSQSSSVTCTQQADNKPVLENGDDVYTPDHISAPCSPCHSDRDSRPSTPKVPPLKIIIPPKSQSTTSTTTDTNDKLKPATKSALPYVINPYQSGGRDSTNQAVGLDPGSQCLSQQFDQSAVNESVSSGLDLTDNLDNSEAASSEVKVKESESENSEINVEMDVNSSEESSAKSQDKKVNEKDENKGSDSDSKKDGNKKDEPPQRVLRSTVRSQQQSSTTTTSDNKAPKLVSKVDKLDRNSNSNSPLLKDESTVSTSKPTKEEEDICIHPRKRKVRPKADSTEQQVSQIPAENGEEIPVVNNPNLVVEKVPNPYEIFLSLRKKIASRRLGYLDMLSISSLKTPQGFKDYLLKTCNYVLQGNNTSTLSIPTISPPNSVKDKMRDMFDQQEKARYKLRLQHLIEREKLILSIEQEILRVHGRAACALANQGTPLSVCAILRDEEIYNFTEDQVRLEEKDKKNRTRYNGRQFLSWLQDVDDKYEKIKELLILRQKQEADSLYAYQRLEWEWRMVELGLCERNITPDIDELHVPLVHVQDNFDLLPT
ncbi:ankyrin repeat [Mactra antiquata]